MGRGKTPLLSALIILAMLSEILGWVVPDFCQNYECPEFTVINKNDDYEERMYVETLWMTVRVKGTSLLDLTEGFSKLQRFCKGNNIEGISVPSNNWPALITQGEEEDGSQSVSVSWFFPPGTVLPTPKETSMSKEVRPAGIVYVRTFSGKANEEKALTAANELRQALKQTQKSFDTNKRTGAGYNRPWDMFTEFHNEIWFTATTPAQD